MLRAILRIFHFGNLTNSSVNVSEIHTGTPGAVHLGQGGEGAPHPPELPHHDDAPLLAGHHDGDDFDGLDPWLLDHHG
jgi:hypothetical protein